MASPSIGWLKSIPATASRVYFFIIIFQIPLFRITCTSGICSTPLEVTSSQLITSGIMPAPAVKFLLYPGAIIHGMIRNKSVPSWDNLLELYNLTSTKETSGAPDLQRLEVLAGSYFSVAGSFIGLLERGRMTMFGTLLILWGLIKEGILRKPSNSGSSTVYVYPTMIIALICAFSSIRYNLHKVRRSVPLQPSGKPLRSSLKSKLK